MQKDQRRELQRLEEALLQPEDWEAAEETTGQWLEECYEKPPVPCNAYNADQNDVDFERYSETVYQGRRRRGCLIPMTLLLLAVLGLLMGLFLWKEGVNPWAS